MASSMMTGRMAELRGQRAPFVTATVVRAERPTSARPGDAAIVLADGTIEGFVGGVCAEASVRAKSLDCLASGQSMLLRIVAKADSDSGDPVGVETVTNPCLSGGGLEIFLEPVVPAALVYVVGTSPIALALGRGAGFFGFDLRLGEELPKPLPSDTSAVVVASHGRGEDQALIEALDSNVPYVGLVASPRRGTAVLQSLAETRDYCQAHLARIHTPAGLDLGAKTPEEVALSILAEIVQERPREPNRLNADPRKPGSVDRSQTVAIDPVCAMSVAAVPASLQVEHNQIIYYFCGSGCLEAFTANPSNYLH